MKRTFENYLIMVGARSDEYTYTDDQLFDNTDYFKKCYEDNLSAYKALLFLHDHLQELNTKIEQALNIPVVVQAKPEKYCKGSIALGTGCKKCKRCLDFMSKFKIL